MARRRRYTRVIASQADPGKPGQGRIAAPRGYRPPTQDPAYNHPGSHGDYFGPDREHLIPPKKGVPFPTPPAAGAPGAGGGGAPTASAPTSAPPAPAPQLPGSVAAIAGANQRAGLDVADINAALFQAAMRYGGNPNAQQYRLNANFVPESYTVGVGPNENSAVSEIGRALTQGTRQTGLSHNDINTFFSGLHAEDVQDLQNESARRRQAALDEYNAAVGQLNSALQEALAARQGTVTEAGAADIEAARALEPEATGDLPVSPGPPPAPGAPPRRPIGGTRGKATPTEPYRGPAPRMRSLSKRKKKRG